MDLRIGISTRQAMEKSYSEMRDCIATDWALYMTKHFRNCRWMYLPNIGEEIVDYCQLWNLNAFILTGGNDIGESKDRDSTEYALLEYAINGSKPLLGVCRGLQIIYSYFGGEIRPGEPEFVSLHRATRHYVRIGNEDYDVNSFHTNELSTTSIPKDLTVLAKGSEDESIEAIQAKGILGIMWHPEREKSVQHWNTEMIRNLFFRSDVYGD